MASWRPASTEGMYSLRDAATGDLVDELVAAVAVAAACGSMPMCTLAYWPEPPVCFLWVYSTFSTALRMVSR